MQIPGKQEANWQGAAVVYWCYTGHVAHFSDIQGSHEYLEQKTEV